MHAVPGIEAVGDHVARIASGLQLHHGVEVARGSRRQDRLRRRGDPRLASHPDQHPVVVGRQRPPGPVRLAPERKAVPRAHDAPVPHEAVREAGPHVGTVVGRDDDGAVRPPGNVVLPGNPVAPRRGADLARRVDHVPSAGWERERVLERALDPGRLRLLPVGRVRDPLRRRQLLSDVDEFRLRHLSSPS